MDYYLDTFQEVMPKLLSGAGIAIGVVIGAELIGTVLGLLLALARLSGRRWLSVPAIVYVDIIRGTPMLVQILFVYYGVRTFITEYPISRDPTFNAIFPYAAGIVALGINSAAYVSEIYRSALGSIDRGQVEAARALGLSSVETFRYVVFPQALRIAIPPLGNEFITLLKDTSLLSFIAVPEIVKQAEIYRGRTYRVVPTYLAVAMIYLVMTLTISNLLRLLERKLRVPR